MNDQRMLLLLTGVVLMFTACRVNQTKETKLPDVDVSVEEGQLPAFNVNWADVDVGTKIDTVKIPKIKVVMEEEEIEVPYVDVNMPDESDKEELTLTVEAEVEETGHDLEIIEVYATGRRLYVISELEPNDEDLQDERMRVADRIILNAPDLDVKHYIIGKRPTGDFNKQYSYIASRSDISDKLKDGKSIYTK